jgi:hypothetical protein
LPLRSDEQGLDAASPPDGGLLAEDASGCLCSAVGSASSQLRD